MIRIAVGADRDRVVGLLRASHLAAGFAGAPGGSTFAFPFDPAYASRLFLAHLASPRALCLVQEVLGAAQGVLMAVAQEHPFGTVWMARETVWFIDPSHRGSAAVRMLEHYEAWARAQGCVYSGMAGMGSDPDVAKLYRRRGYGIAETHFLKVL